MNNYTPEMLPDQEQLEQPEYGYKRKMNVVEVEVVGFCPCCDKRLTSLDNLYVNKFEVFCSNDCLEKFEEEFSNEQN